MYDDTILINTNVANYKVRNASKLELIFTLLHEIADIKRINFSFDGDHLSKTPRDFINSLSNLIEMSEQEKIAFMDEPEIGETFEMAILGTLLYKERDSIILDEKNCTSLLDAGNWKCEVFLAIENEIKREISENPKSSQKMSFNREYAYPMECSSHFNLNSDEDDKLIFGSKK